MGCGSCGTTTGGVSAGCGNNGTCGTSGCNKLNVYNWLSDMELPDGQQQYAVVEVRFKGSHKDFFRKQENMDLKTGDIVAVEGNPGHDIGTVSLAGELVRLQLKKKRMEENSSDIKTLYRIARPVDIEKWESVKALESSTMFRARTIANSYGLKMKLSDVEFQGDGKKATFFYTAEDRVDFRELIKKLAEEFRVRVEMKQVGMRQEASRLGGIGSCGRELCCSTWLTNFKAVSTSAARYQNLSLNQAKLAGQCGKLKCCLNYELDSYLDALKDIPDGNIRLQTTKGTAIHQKTDIFKRLLWYSLIIPEKKDEDHGHSDKWIVISVDRAKEIIEMNRNNQKPDDLADPDMEVVVEAPDYMDMVGQDSLTRMDNRKKKKKKKKRNRNPGNPNAAPPPQNRPPSQRPKS
ncbi:MAG: regulatory iron-sulfur-containing complex subunit RicT [Bacteroidota bacterium]